MYFFSGEVFQKVVKNNIYVIKCNIYVIYTSVLQFVT